MNSREAQFLANIRSRFILERVSGYLDTKGVRHAPVALSAAKRLWYRHRPRFLKVLKDVEVREKFKLDEQVLEAHRPAARP